MIPSAIQQRALQLACEHLQRLGLQILDRLPAGPDAPAVIAYDGATIVFASISWRLASSKARGPVQFARRWLSAHRRLAGASRLRFDAVDVVLDERLALISLSHTEAVAHAPANGSRHP